MPTVRELMREMAGQVDVSLPGALYASVSVNPERVRWWLRAAGRPFIERGAEVPKPEQLLETGRWVIGQSRFRVALVGGLAGLWGAASVPPEALASTIALLRLAQRLAQRWQRPYSQVCGYLNARMSVAIARATARCITGSRVPWTRVSHALPLWEDGAGLSLFDT